MMNDATENRRSTALVIDDERQMRRLLRVTLESHGFRVLDSASGQDGIAQAAQFQPNVILLDLSLPDMDGVVVLNRLRERSQAPVIVLSVRDGESDKVAALDAGADDYLTKPFGTDELLARLRVTHRHSQRRAKAEVFQSGHLEVHLISRTVKVGGQEVRLTTLEYALLRLFIQHAGQALSHQQILREIWGPDQIEQTHYVRIHIAHLREKIESDPSRPELIITEPGVGYRLIEKEPAAVNAAAGEPRSGAQGS